MQKDESKYELCKIVDEFRIEFYIDTDFNKITKKINAIKKFHEYSLLSKPFNGIYCIDIDNIDILRLKDLQDDFSLTLINYPFDKINWLNNNYTELLKPSEPKYKEKEWKKKHLFTYPGGDYSLDIPMYSDGKYINIEWNIGDSFVIPKGKIKVPLALFAENVLKSIKKANAFFNLFGNLKQFDMIKSFEAKLRENEKYFKLI